MAADETSTNIESILREGRKFAPSPAFVRQAAVKGQAEYEALYRRAEQDPEGFWGDCARELAKNETQDTAAQTPASIAVSR